jgi:hypothetical protein
MRSITSKSDSGRKVHWHTELLVVKNEENHGEGGLKLEEVMWPNYKR